MIASQVAFFFFTHGLVTVPSNKTAQGFSAQVAAPVLHKMLMMMSSLMYSCVSFPSEPNNILTNFLKRWLLAIISEAIIFFSYFSYINSYFSI